MTPKSMKQGTMISRPSILLAMAAGAAVLPPSRVAASTGYERAVLDALNVARADPATYAHGLEDYRRLYQGRFVHLPGDPVLERTREGIAPVTETIAFLTTRATMTKLQPSDVLAATAADHVRAQAASGATGHGERGGIGPLDRFRAHGGGGQLSEVIAYGPRDPADMIRQLFIDDGVAGRGHRRILVDPSLRYAGVACGPHRIYRTMCVIDLSRSWNGGGTADPKSWALARAAAFTRWMSSVVSR